MNSEIRKRIQAIIKHENIDRAIERIHGYGAEFYWDDWIWYELGALYRKKGEKRLAGRYLFCKENASENEKECVEIYKSSYGGSLTVIAREQIGHRHKSPVRLSRNVKFVLFVLLEELRADMGYLPAFSLNWYNHLRKEFPKGRQS